MTKSELMRKQGAIVVPAHRRTGRAVTLRMASTVCSYLWFKSGYIPRALSAFGLISSAWCVLCALAFLVFPNFNYTVNDWLFDTPMGLFEMATGFWILFKGLRPESDPRAP